MSAAAPVRAVLDTNVLVSALIFRGGVTATLRQGWQNNAFQPLVSQPTAKELIQVLAYPKFKLTPADQEELLADYLPFCLAIQLPTELPSIPECRDPFDRPFLHLALVGQADYLVTGDRDLLSLRDHFACPIVRVEEFFEMLSS